MKFLIRRGYCRGFLLYKSSGRCQCNRDDVACVYNHEPICRTHSLAVSLGTSTFSQVGSVFSRNTVVSYIRLMQQFNVSARRMQSAFVFGLTLYILLTT